jgi:hypothetical protein
VESAISASRVDEDVLGATVVVVVVVAVVVAVVVNSGGLKTVGRDQDVGESDVTRSKEWDELIDDGDAGAALDPLWLSSEGEYSAPTLTGLEPGNWRGSRVGGYARTSSKDDI